MKSGNRCSPSAVTRRDLLAWTGGALAGACFFTVFASESSEFTTVAPQPYFATVSRALEALVKLGTPVTAADAQQIAALTRQNDLSAVDAAENILGRYTLARLSIDDHGSVRVATGDTERTLVEQGWRMFLLRVANPAGRTGSIAFLSGGATPGRMTPSTSDSAAQRAFLMDTLNKAPLIERMWVMTRVYETTTKYPAHYKFPAHWHDADEDITVLAGSIYMGGEDGKPIDKVNGALYKKGDKHLLPMGHVHWLLTTNEPAVIKVGSPGPFGMDWVEQ